MKDVEIDSYAAIMQKWGLKRLTVSEEGTVIRLEREDNNKGAQPISGETRPGAPEKEEPIPFSEETKVCSPMIGVFYAARAENAEPFVSVGDAVKKGDTVCIIEAMKLMNEIRAESDGIITRICVTDGQMVEYGTELFWIREVKAG